MNSSFSIANHIINHFNGKIDLMKLQILIYYAQGWNLIINEEPLINEYIRLDKYGIRIDSLYFSLIGNYSNNELILKNNYHIKQSIETFTGLNIDMGNSFEEAFTFTFPMSEIHCLKKETISLLNEIIEGYGKFSTIKLSNMIHSEPHIFAKYNGKYETIEETYLNNEELKYSFKKLDNRYNKEKIG
jgi:uncharacterized phage-associated protein